MPPADHLPLQYASPQATAGPRTSGLILTAALLALLPLVSLAVVLLLLWNTPSGIGKLVALIGVVWVGGIVTAAMHLAALILYMIARQRIAASPEQYRDGLLARIAAAAVLGAVVFDGAALCGICVLIAYR
jgi:hypothetical protein